MFGYKIVMYKCINKKKDHKLINKENRSRNDEGNNLNEPLFVRKKFY